MKKPTQPKKINAEKLNPQHRPAGGGVFVRDPKTGIKKQLEGPGKAEFNAKTGAK